MFEIFFKSSNKKAGGIFTPILSFLENCLLLEFFFNQILSDECPTLRLCAPMVWIDYSFSIVFVELSFVKLSPNRKIAL